MKELKLLKQEEAGEESVMGKDNGRTKYELQAEAEELSDVLRRLDAVRGMVRESWSGNTSKAFLDKLEDVILEADSIKTMISKL